MIKNCQQMSHSSKTNCSVDGNLREWQPKAFHRICSAHFVGNVKSNDPSFNPTIFPQVRLVQIM